MGWGDGKSRSQNRIAKADDRYTRRETKTRRKYARDHKRMRQRQNAGCAVTALAAGLALAGAVARLRGWS